MPFFAGMAALLALLSGGSCCQAQQPGIRVTSLGQARLLYVPPFEGGSEAAALRASFVQRLDRSHRFRITQSEGDADAIVNGTGQIWLKGYITINARTPSSDREAVYGGYLSLEVAGVDGQPLWSWLVTPSKLVWTNIVDNLADQAAKKLVEAGESTSPAPAVQSPAAVLARTSIDAAGATFPAPLYQMWFEDFEQFHTAVHLHYSAIGSQLGVEKLVAGQVDLAGSDVAPRVIAGDAAAARLTRIASVLGGVVPIYHLAGVTQDLRFNPETLADIYLGKVHRWNDPEIRRSNRGIDLPDAEIKVFHRSDGSGTSWVWSDFLSKVSPAWSAAVGRGTLLKWPVGTGAEHNEGVAEAVAKTPNSIGYVELTYAIQHELSFAAVRNRAGEYVRASLDSLTEAARSSGASGGQLPPDITDSPGKYAYPVASFTWLVIPARAADPAKRAVLLELFRWILTSGQKECSALGYAALPKEVAEYELRLLGGNP